MTAKNGKMTDVQRAYWQDSGSKPAETAVRIWKFLPSPNLCEAATSPICRHVRGNACASEQQCVLEEK